MSEYWSAAEDAVLRDQYPTVFVTEIASQIPGRTAAAIANRAKKLGLMALRRHRVFELTYTAEEDDLIRELYYKVPTSQIAKRLGRSSKNAIISRAHRIGAAKEVPIISFDQRIDELHVRFETAIGLPRADSVVVSL